MTSVKIVPIDSYEYCSQFELNLNGTKFQRKVYLQKLCDGVWSGSIAINQDPDGDLAWNCWLETLVKCKFVTASWKWDQKFRDPVYITTDNKLHTNDRGNVLLGTMVREAIVDYEKHNCAKKAA